MDLETIRLLYGYHNWVNDRLLTRAEDVPPERTKEHFGASFDTIHGTLAHILGSEITWLNRWRGNSPAKQIGGEDFASLAEIRDRWVSQRQEMDAFIAQLTPEQLAAPLRYKNYAGMEYELPLWQLMLHLVNHGTHHRSELADMLTRTGYPPQPTDLTRYCFELTGQE